MPLKFKERLAMSPPGGWYFVEEGTTIRGENPQEVAEKVKDYRITNGHLPGNPMDDLIRFCAARWPNLVCQSDKEAEVVTENPVYETAWNWLIAISRYVNPGDVSRVQADAQEAICKACPFNTEYPISNYILKSDFERRSYLMRKGAHGSVGYCAFHGWDNRVAVVRNRNAINAQPDAPPECWMNLDLSGLRPDVVQLPSGK